MKLGAFSFRLAVKHIAASRAFYEKLGFKVSGGDQAKKWMVLQNETATIGLFQGMFEKNSLTFNPGWDRSKNNAPRLRRRPRNPADPGGQGAHAHRQGR